MITPSEMIEEVKRIKSAIEQIEIKGADNANFVLYSCQRCDFLINAVNETIKVTMEKQNNQNEGVEAGE